MIDEVEYLVEMGFAVHILRPKSKSPVEDNWSNADIYTFRELKVQYREWTKGRGNVGVRLGEPSRLEDGYLHAIDLDIRDPDAQGEAVEALKHLMRGYGLFRFWTVRSGSGGHSRHYYFVTDRPFPTRNLAKSSDFVELDGRKRRAWEIDLLGTGKQIVLPPSIHDETGKAYEWLVQPDDMPLVIDSDHIEDLINDDGAYEEIDNDDPVGMSLEEAEDMINQVSNDADDHETWRDIGMMLKHEFGDDAWPLFDRWSKKGRGYNKRDNRYQWDKFDNTRARKLTMRSLQMRIRDMEYETIADEFEDGDVVRREVAEQDEENGEEKVVRLKVKAPKSILKIPGVLQEVVDQFNKFSQVPQPEFAVMAALAVGSVITSRNIVSSHGNYTSLYFIGAAQSGGGKESVRTVVRETLRKCKLDFMVGPENFTSEGAILSEFMRSPRIVLLTDEFGKRLAADRGGSNANTDGVYTAYLSLFSQLGSQWRPRAYSAMGKTAEEAKTIADRKIERPAMSIVATTTPETLFEAIGSGDVASGLFSRFIIVKGDTVRTTKLPRLIDMKVSEDFKKWANRVSSLAALDEEGEDYNSLMLMADPNAIVEPHQIKFSDRAIKMLETEIGEFVNTESDKLVSHGLAALWNRAREITMRIAMIVSLSKGSFDEIDAESVKWAWEYVRHYICETVADFMTNLGVNPNLALSDQLAEMICSWRANGMTKRDLSKFSRAYRSLTSRDAQEVEMLLERNHDIKLRKPEGSRRIAYIAPKESWTLRRKD